MFKIKQINHELYSIHDMFDQKQVDEISGFVQESKAYLKGNKAVKNLPYEAMGGLFDGSKKLYIHVNDEKGITDAVNFYKEHGIKSMVIIGGYQAYKVADLLKQNNVGVLINHTHSRPASDDHDYDLPFRNAKILIDKGITVAIGMEGQMERMNTRNLPFYAGTYAAYGVDKEQAVAMITGNAAKVLGIDDFAGTLIVF